MRNFLLAVVATASLVGCVGGIETTSPPPIPTEPPPDGTGGGATGPAAAEARKLFEDTVYPVISGKCIGCHKAGSPAGNVTAFVAATKTDSYVTAVGYQALVGNWTPAAAPILTKIAGGHQNQSYTQTEKDAITAWLNKELTARATGGGDTGGDTIGAAVTRVTKEFSGCMSLTNFTTANMVAFGNLQSNEGRCKACHFQAEYSMIAQDVAPQYFTLLSTNSGLVAQYVSVDTTGGAAAAKVVINTRSFTAAGGDLAPHFTHPRFTFAGSAAETALKKFYDLTVAAKAIPAGSPGACGAPTL